jgi:hypothetical protein
VGFELKRRRQCFACGTDLETAKRDASKALVFDDHSKFRERAEAVLKDSPRSYLAFSWVEAIVTEAEALKAAADIYRKALDIIQGATPGPGMDQSRVAAHALEEALQAHARLNR